MDSNTEIIWDKNTIHSKITHKVSAIWKWISDQDLNVDFI